MKLKPHHRFKGSFPLRSFAQTFATSALKPMPRTFLRSDLTQRTQRLSQRNAKVGKVHAACEQFRQLHCRVASSVTARKSLPPRSAKCNFLKFAAIACEISRNKGADLFHQISPNFRKLRQITGNCSFLGDFRNEFLVAPLF